MVSKSARSKLDHDETRTRQPKTHWDHVLEEMVWLSKHFELEKKCRLARAKRLAKRARKFVLDQETKGEKKAKEEEQRIRKVAHNISKEVKRFWTKIENLVLYKYHLDVEERKKKSLDKQLDFLLGQTERYSTMLAENLVDMPHTDNSLPKDSMISHSCDFHGDENVKHSDESLSDIARIDDNYGILSKDESEVNQRTIDEDEFLTTEEEHRVELASVKDDVDLPPEELIRHYTTDKVSRKSTPDDGENPNNRKQIKGKEEDDSMVDDNETVHVDVISSDHDDDGEYMPVAEEVKDDETTFAEEEELALKETNDPLDEIKFLQQENEFPIEELLARYKKDALSEYDSLRSNDYQIDCVEDHDKKHSSPCVSAVHGTIGQGKPLQNWNHDSPTEAVMEVDNDTNVRRGSENVAADEDHVTPSSPWFSAGCGTAEQEKALQIGNHDISTITIMEVDNEPNEVRDYENIISDAAADARSAQPTGSTSSTSKVHTKLPFLLKYPLREYQHVGLNWLVTMYEKRLNGILADEMGLGKTIMTISLLAHLACEKGIWGPHLIVVPTSVMLNWETEFLKWCPAFKILTYFGSARERKHKRDGWSKPNYFHVCITTYGVVLQDSKIFKRKKWKYLILDEAHLIKNWKSLRWQTLVNFNSKRRILLTGTPLQNDLMEMWSLMHFLMPHLFQSHQEFKDWFSNPITCMVEGQEKVNKDVVDRLHNVLRPFILRRLKRDVEKQLPKKIEHVMYCRLSKRQRNLYEDFISSSDTQAKLASANFFGMIGIIMQLRKVCNHPDLFEGRPIISSFDMAGIDMQLSSSVCTIALGGQFSNVDLRGLNFIFTQLEFSMASWELDEVTALCTVQSFFGGVDDLKRSDAMGIPGTNILEDIQIAIYEERIRQSKERDASIAWWNSLRCKKKPVYGTDLRKLVSIKHPVFDIDKQKNNPSCYMTFSSKLADVVFSPSERFHTVFDLVECFMFAIPAARATAPLCWCSKVDSPVFLHSTYKERFTNAVSSLLSPVRPAIVRRQLYFPDRRLIQFDCGKLQKLAVLLRCLKSEGHRALIFTQMTKMLDILEAFINLYGFTYMRMDGSTPPEERQTLMQRFNTNPKYFLFILSTRSGGVGINLVGADTVIFYDSDWNPAMDQQAQDRCHRIGQIREVHIYRLISESTIEENILKKANQKRVLDDLVIQSGSYNTDFLNKLDPIQLFSDNHTLDIEDLKKACNLPAINVSSGGEEDIFSNVDVEAALKQAEDEADYMALKNIEQEDAVENQVFIESLGRLEDDELVNDDRKSDDITVEKHGTSIVSKNKSVMSFEGILNEDKSCGLAERVEDIDMLANIKKMVASATTAGEASFLFENKLRPIDRYAMNFLDLWDPINDKSEEESSEEDEWELDREAEIESDDDEESLLCEKWDAEIASESYKQHIEALTRQQLLEELECDVDDENGKATRNEFVDDHKPNSKKNSKKTKFKSLRKESLPSDMEVEVHDELEMNLEAVGGNSVSPEFTIQNSSRNLASKRKQRLFVPEEEPISRKSLKKLKRACECNYAVYSDTITNMSKMGGKLSISLSPVKQIILVQTEKPKSKGYILNYMPSPDSWRSQEDAVLSAVVHEYGTNWRLVNDVIHGMTAGGFYRGRYRHPFHCRERFKDLLFRHNVLSTHNSGKVAFEVSQEQMDTLLNVVSDIPDRELLIEKHFTALLSAVWRSRRDCDRAQNISASSRKIPRRPMDSTVLRKCSNTVAEVLREADRTMTDNEKPVIVGTEEEASGLQVVPPSSELTVVFPDILFNSEAPFPRTVHLSFSDPNTCSSVEEVDPEQNPFLRSFHSRAEPSSLEDEMFGSTCESPCSSMKSPILSVDYLPDFAYSFVLDTTEDDDDHHSSHDWPLPEMVTSPNESPMVADFSNLEDWKSFDDDVEIED